MGFAANTDCPFCQSAPDGQQHRQWECDFFADLRMMVPAEIRQQAATLAPCFRDRGWATQVPSQLSFERSLHEIPDTMYDYHAIHLPDGPLRMFSEGACKEPGVPALRLATWAVQLADLTNDSFMPLSQGGLIGLLHTPLRAEIAAAISAIAFAVKVRRVFFLWVDNQMIHDRLQSWKVHMPEFFSHMQRDHDLWSLLLFWYSRACQHSLVANVVKVRSHEDEGAYPCHVERWAIRGNAAVDAAAESAFESLPQVVRARWTQFSKDWFQYVVR